ncbi:hypothetical protein PIB30_074412 [Stylosanthes scabra]|uniref:Disease resistance protein winged helix domain-containing protein n=1 Tax=Stylosanthes scabra TaxID=79078 RepID=A0ABU6TPA9_9FABA|nr:hypothetical protein [Stylosanthes scabra]
MKSNEIFVALVHHDGRIKYKTRDDVKFTDKSSANVFMTTRTTLVDLQGSIVRKLGLDGRKRVKIYYQIPISVVARGVKYGCLAVEGDDDLQILFHCRKQFPEVRTTELFVEIADSLASSGDSAPIPRPVNVGETSGSRNQRVVSPVASPSFDFNLQAEMTMGANELGNSHSFGELGVAVAATPQPVSPPAFEGVSVPNPQVVEVLRHYWVHWRETCGIRAYLSIDVPRDMRNAVEMIHNIPIGGGDLLKRSRLKEVASHTSPCPPYILQLLGDDESWEFFSRKVFRGEECPSDIEDLGKQMVRSCGGLPLSIVVLTGLLANKGKSHRKWSKVVGHVNWYLTRDETQVKDIVLKLSHDSLPTRLKPCFLYLGMYPEDFEIRVRPLLQKWVVEGFIQQTGTRYAEDDAEDYLYELVDRSLVQASQVNVNGVVKAHDLVRVVFA